MKTRSRLTLAATLLLCGAAHAARADEAAAPRCKYVQVAKLPLRYVGLGLQPAVDGSINGEPATLLVDTGGSEAFLTMTGVLRHHLPLQLSRDMVQGVGGLSRLAWTRLEDLAVGPAHVKRPELQVIRETGFVPSFDGILGAPFLLAFDVEVDLRAKQIRFFEPRDCNHPKLKIWKEDTVSVPFDTSRHQGANPHFTVLINGKEVDAMIDTGAGRSALMLAAAKRVGIDMNDPRIKSLGKGYGIGSRMAQDWSAPLESLQIGDETIQHPSITVIDSQALRDNVDLLLGQDFLRAHRVLFAASQRQLYVAYLGGPVFLTDGDTSDWVRQEAEGGNADAQYLMATGDHGGAGGTAWMEKAAAAGSPYANLALGRRDLARGRVEQAVQELRTAVAQLPTEGYAPLLLYDARVRAGQGELARSELEASVDKRKDDAWPTPIARFYLGRENADQLLADAGQDAHRRCDAATLMADWHAAHGAQAKADAVRAEVECKAAP
jgi:predicted aspartyl protease